MTEHNTCKDCKHLLVALEGNSNVEPFSNKYFKKKNELFCENPKTPDVFWNNHTGESPDVMLNFGCRYFEANE